MRARPGAAAGASLSGSGGLGWQNDAACKGADPDLFFTPDIAPRSDVAEHVAEQKRREETAKAICRTCPVRLPCLEWRISDQYQQDGGIWGGLDEDQRRRLRRNRIRAESAAKRRAAA